MYKYNKDKPSCKDVFNAFMVENANYAGNLEIPILDTCNEIPKDLVCFSKINQSTDYKSWIHFYEHDYVIERIWKNPRKYLPIIKKFSGIITPDFSLYRDMPLAMQINNVLRSRMVGRWMQDNGVHVIPNIRFGDRRTYRLSCLGVSKHSTIAVGTHGTLRSIVDRKIMEEGIEWVLNYIHPNALIIYGSATDKMIESCSRIQTKLLVFKSDFHRSHLRNKEVR